MKFENTPKTVFCENLHENIAGSFENGRKIFGKVEKSLKAEPKCFNSNHLKIIIIIVKILVSIVVAN